MTKDIQQILLNRRTVRSFRPLPIEESDKRFIQEATLRAPTAGNMALYSVIDVTDSAIKKELADLCDHQGMIATSPMVWVFVSDYQKWVDWFKADHCDEKSGKPFITPGWGDMHLGFQDAIIAAESAVLAAETRDIGSCYIGDILENGEKVQQLLNLPRFTAPACMVIFGYKNDSKVDRLSPRCPVEDMFMENGYHQRTSEEIRKAFSEHEEQSRKVKRLPYDNTGSLADYYYGRKYTSSFMEEMNRSVQYWFTRWLTDDHTSV